MIMRIILFIKLFLVFLFINVDSKAQATGKEIELLTVCVEDVPWSKKIRLTSKRKSLKSTTLYLKSGESSEEFPKLTPVIEVNTTGNALISTKKGYKYARELQKGDEVFCKNTGGLVNTYEIGLVYGSK